ncbi:hypothetical protein C8R43DRAFT_1142443 [Mycena crocata]|nr:hypothetical protein C8R43DRAFT_1142443 [Mycena crocata]
MAKLEDRPQAALVEELWFPRDTILIRAEDKLLQVSRAILAARSTVFGDMLAFPRPTSGSDDNEVIDGNPVVQLHDSAADVTVFLRAIFDLSYFMPSPAAVELHVVLGVLRLAHKYDVVYAYRRALQHLIEKGWYSVTFDAQAVAHHIQFPSSTKDIAAIAGAAAEAGAQWLLLWAYYMLSAYLLGDLTTLEVEIPAQMHCREQMLRAMITAQRVLTVADTCDTIQSCDRIRMAFLASFIDEEQEMTTDEWSPENIRILGDSGLCNACCANVEVRARASASAFWDAVPGIFGHGSNYMQ